MRLASPRNWPDELVGVLLCRIDGSISFFVKDEKSAEAADLAPVKKPITTNIYEKLSVTVESKKLVAKHFLFQLASLLRF